MKIGGVSNKHFRMRNADTDGFLAMNHEHHELGLEHFPSTVTNPRIVVDISVGSVVIIGYLIGGLEHFFFSIYWE